MRRRNPVGVHITTTATRPTVCPNCGHGIDAATNFQTGDAPAAGDLTLCFACEGLLVFTDRLALRALTPAEARRVATDPPTRAFVRFLRGAIQLTKRLGPGPVA